MNNLVKSAIGLAVYWPLAALNMAAEIVARKTEPWCEWFERDEPAPPCTDSPPDAWRGPYALKDSE